MNKVEIKDFENGLRVILFQTQDGSHEFGFAMHKQDKVIRVWELVSLSGNILAESTTLPLEWLEMVSLDKMLTLDDGGVEAMRTPLGRIFVFSKADFGKIHDFLNERKRK